MIKNNEKPARVRGRSRAKARDRKPYTRKPISADVADACALVEVALELKYGNLDRLLTQNKDETEDTILEIEQLIAHLKEAVRKLEVNEEKLQDLLPQLIKAVGDDVGEQCPESDPRRDELFSLLARPVTVLSVNWWKRVSASSAGM
jgi:hypothetical protein